MRKLFWAAVSYMILGVAAGVFYREFTKANDFTGETQLSVMHTHLLALGMLVFLVVIALERLFALSRSTAFTVFFWVYNAGLILLVTMMGVTGARTVLGHESSSALAGIAGMGHIVITAGLVALFVALYQGLFRTDSARHGDVRATDRSGEPEAAMR